MMKRIVLLLAIVCLLGCSWAYAQDVLIATGEYSPYTSEKLAGNGFSAEIVTAAFAASGITAKYEFLPWKRCEAGVESGDYYGTIPYLKTPEREQRFAYSDAFYVSRSSFFYMKDAHPDFAYSSLSDMKKYVLGGAAGYYYEKAFADAGLNVEYADDATSSLKKLHAGRVDFFPEDDLAAWAMIKELFPGEEGKFAATEKAFNEDPHYIMVSKKFAGADELTRKFNEGLAKIKADGTYDAIMKKYGLMK